MCNAGASSTFTLCVTKTGAVYSFGYEANGALGVGEHPAGVTSTQLCGQAVISRVRRSGVLTGGSVAARFELRGGLIWEGEGPRLSWLGCVCVVPARSTRARHAQPQWHGYVWLSVAQSEHAQPLSL